MASFEIHSGLLKKGIGEIRARGALASRAVFVFLLLVNLSWAAAFFFRPSFDFILPPENIHPESGSAYLFHLTNPSLFYGLRGDDLADLRRSNLRLFENDQLLGPAHAVHEAVRTSGGGAFSHWGKDLYFSASDNSDPRVNGRVYRVEVRATFRLLAAAVFAALNLTGLVILLLCFARASMISLAAVQGSLTAVLIGYGLYQNIVPVNAAWGRAAYGVLAFAVVLVGLFFVFIESRTVAIRDGLKTKVLRSSQMILMSVLFVFVSLEALCRAFPVPDTLAVNPGCRFFWADWYKYPLNKEGYREREVPAKEEGVYRVLIYGDSYIEGAGVDRASLAGVHLERALNNRLREAGSPLKVQAYNLGHCGANTKQEAFWIERDAAALKPDLVVLAYVLNDAESDAPALVQTASPLMRIFSSLLTGDHGSYLFYRWLKFSALFFPAAKSPKESRQTYIEALHDDSAAGWQEARRALGRIEEFTRNSSIDQFSVVLPLFMRSVSPDMERVMEKVSEAMTTLGMENYNTLDYFSGDGLLQYAFSVNDSHPNAKGHRKLAEFLSEKIWNRDSFRKAAAL